jgi:hypothetical protein
MHDLRERPSLERADGHRAASVARAKGLPDQSPTQTDRRPLRRGSSDICCVENSAFEKIQPNLRRQREMLRKTQGQIHPEGERR